MFAGESELCAGPVYQGRGAPVHLEPGSGRGAVWASARIRSQLRPGAYEPDYAWPSAEEVRPGGTAFYQAAGIAAGKPAGIGRPRGSVLREGRLRYGPKLVHPPDGDRANSGRALAESWHCASKAVVTHRSLA